MAEEPDGRQAREIAQREGLGPHQGAYPSMAPSFARHATFTGVATAVLGVLMLLCLTSAYKALALVLAPAFLICVYSLIRSTRIATVNQGARLDLWERGLTVTTTAGVRVVRYERTNVLQHIVRHTQYGNTVRVSYSYTMDDTTGRQVVLRNMFVAPEEWGPAIQHAVTAIQFPLAVARIQAGERLEFGNLWISATEVGSRNKSAHWSQVQEIQVRDGYVSLNVEGKWLSLSLTPVSRIPNYFVFITLAERLRAIGHSRL